MRGREINPFYNTLKCEHHYLKIMTLQFNW